MLNIVIASVLFILTLGLVYAFWYVVRGRRKVQNAATEKKPSPEEQAQAEETETKKRKEGYSRDDYCYPKINDIMGYDFVKVVEVPEHLRPKKDAAPAEPEEKHVPSWDKGSSSGMHAVEGDDVKDEVPAAVEATSAEARQEDVQNLDDQDTARKYDNYVDTQRGNAETEDGEEEEEMNDISEEDYAALQNGAAVVDWPMNENDDPARYDEYIEENPDVIEAGDSEEEAQRVAAETNDWKRDIESMAFKAENEARSLLDGIGENDEQEKTD